MKIINRILEAYVDNYDNTRKYGDIQITGKEYGYLKIIKNHLNILRISKKEEKENNKYDYFPLIEMVFVETKDKGSYTIIDDVKYRNKYYLINEILENTKDTKDITFEERLDKAIKDHEQLIKYKKELEDLNKELEDLKSEQGNSFNPEAKSFILGSQYEVKLTPIETKEEEIKLKEKQIKDLQNSKENLYPDKVKSWIRQLENLRDKKVNDKLNPEEKTEPTEHVVVPTTQTTSGEGKVNLKVPYL